MSINIDKDFNEEMHRLNKEREQQQLDIMEAQMSLYDTRLSEANEQTMNMSRALANTNTDVGNEIAEATVSNNALAEQAFDEKYYESFSKVNTAFEGDKDVAYVPFSYQNKDGIRSKDYGTSGVSIGQGIDLGQTSKEKAKEYGMSDRLIKAYSDAGAFGAKGSKAASIARKLKKLVKATPEEMKAMSRGVYNSLKGKLRDYSNKYPNLSKDTINTLVQADHWSGGIFNRTKEPGKFTRNAHKLGLKGKQLINPLAELLETNPNATDTDVSTVISLLQKSYGNGRPLNSTTLQRYQNLILRGDPDKKA